MSNIIVVNKPRESIFELDLSEIYSFRDLFIMLVWRDILVRYKQTLLGAAWAILQPLASMLIFTLFFGKLAKIPSDDVPYPVFSYSGLVLWTFFATALSFSSQSLVANERLVTKIFFPRIIIPVSAIMACFVDLMIASTLFVIILPYFGVALSPNIWALPFMVLLAFITVSGAGLLISALNVKYRDFRHVIPFLTQFWMFASPVVYPASMVPEQWRFLFGLNPMAGAIEGFRWALIGTGSNPLTLVITSYVAAIALLIVGLVYFNKTEEFFADLI